MEETQLNKQTNLVQLKAIKKGGEEHRQKQDE